MTVPNMYEPDVGDIIMVCGPTHRPIRGFLARMICDTLSTEERQCHHSHDGFIYRDENNMLRVLNVVSPKARSDDFYEYTRGLVKAQAKWCVVRPNFLCEPKFIGDFKQFEAYRTHFSYMCDARVGTDYPEKDLWILYKRWMGMQISWISEERHARYCTQTGKMLYALHAIHPWKPLEWEQEDLPATIHTELMCEHGKVQFIKQSHSGFYQMLSNQHYTGGA